MSHKLHQGIQENVPLSQHTSWRIGGPARHFFQPQNKEELAKFLTESSEKGPIFWMGLGSNLLVRDGGISATVISTILGFLELEQVDAITIRAEAGVSCAKVARFCARLGLEGAEFLAGIPGTMGGALAMNAGCYGSETWEYVSGVEMVTRKGDFKLRQPADFNIAYREVKGPENEYFVAGYLRLKRGNREVALDKIRALLERRASTQPTGDHSCGSVFRNPPNDYAGRLIEASGLKNLRCGGAKVSEKHANFIVNEGTATAADVEQLIELVSAKVKLEHGVELIKEVRIVGDKLK